jgi:TonB family protein
MKTMLIYLFESTFCISALYAIYWFFMRRDTYFMLNRIYMLGIILVSMLLPLLPLNWIPASPSASVVIWLQPVLITPGRVQQTMMEHLQWMEVAAVVYLTGVVIFFTRLAMQLIQLWLITRRFGIVTIEGERVVSVDRGYAPFSFFNLVFINREMVPEKKMTAILEHERVHIRQFHSIDMMLYELTTIFQWFNPVVWMAGRELKSIHEYLADEGVLQNGISRPQYQQMILDESMGIRVNNLTNNFNVSLLKKRIAMMTKSKSGKWAKSKVLAALPVLFLLVFMLTARSYSNTESVKITRQSGYAVAGFHSDPVQTTQDKPKKESQVKYVSPVNGKEVFTVVEKQPSFPGGQDGYTKFLIQNIKYPEEAMKKSVMGTVYITFIIEADGSVTNVKVLRGIGSGCDEEAQRVVKMMPKWNPGQEKGKAVAVQYNLPIKFKLDCEKKEEPKK